MKIKLLISSVIAIIFLAVVSSAFFGARAQARDEHRLIDVGQIAKALNAYYQDNGYYPYSNALNETSALSNYLEYWPQAPTQDGSCTVAQNSYTYGQKAGGRDFELTFCLGTGVKGYGAGPHVVSANGIQ